MVVSGISPMAEVEACVLSSTTSTRILSHVYLRNPDANLDDLLEPVAAERFAAVAEGVKGQAEALIKWFHAFDPAPSTGGVADPATLAGGVGEDNAVVEEASLLGDGSVQG